MRDYVSIFKVRLERARESVEALSSMLEIMDGISQSDSECESVDSEALERLEILSKSVADECSAAKDALRWHKRNND